MSSLSAAQRRYRDNAPLIAAQTLVFKALLRDRTPTVFISDVATTGSGGTPSRSVASYFGGDIPWIKSGDLTDGHIESVGEYITNEGLNNSAAKIFPKGTVVIALYGATVGKTGILTFDAASNQAVCAVLPKDNRVSHDYLFWFLRYKREDFLQASFGGAQPNISQKILRSTVVPLPSREVQGQLCRFFAAVAARQSGDLSAPLPGLPPSLSDQRRIVAKIEQLAAKIEEARGLRESCSREVATIVPRMTESFEGTRFEQCRLGDLLAEESRNGLSAKPSDMPPGVPILRISAGTSRIDGCVDESDCKYLEVNEDDLRKYSLQPGDLLACRFNGNLRYVGRFSLFTGESGEIRLHPDKLIRFRVDRSRVLPEYVRNVMNSPRGRDKIEGFCKTTAGNIGISASNLKSITIPVPPIREQQRLIDYQKNVQSKLGFVLQLNAKTGAALDALLPSVLDRAFKGDL